VSSEIKDPAASVVAGRFKIWRRGSGGRHNAGAVERCQNELIVRVGPLVVFVLSRLLLPNVISFAESVLSSSCGDTSALLLLQLGLPQDLDRVQLWVLHAQRQRSVG
jgi:hypothetical protein